MNNDSFFWANLGVLEKLGVWTPFHDEAKDHGIKRTVYNIFRAVIFIFVSIHTFCELSMVTVHVGQLKIDEITVSVAYSIQHFLGVIKAYIIISRKEEFLDLDRRTKEYPLYRRNDPKFVRAVNETVSMSDKIGFIYWVSVLTTVSCGCVTGVFVTYKNKVEMTKSCLATIQVYEKFWIENSMNLNEMAFANRTNNINEMIHLTRDIENILNEKGVSVNTHDDLVCEMPKKVFPYHIWLPFDGKNSPYFRYIFALNFIAGLCLVCYILPIDLMVMSFMRYIRFQFEVVCDDLEHLRENAIEELYKNGKENGLGDRINEEQLSILLRKRLKNIVFHQNEIYDFFVKANDLFTWILLAQYMASGAMICGVLFSISSVADDMMTPKFFHVAFFYSGLTIQLYTNCLYGNEVFISSETPRASAYVSGWESSGRFSCRIRPELTMIMMRSLRKCRLTAGTFVSVDLPTFLSVFKATYTYYTVLHDDDD